MKMKIIPPQKHIEYSKGQSRILLTSKMPQSKNIFFEKTKKEKKKRGQRTEKNVS